MTAPFPRYNPAADLAACHVGDDEWCEVLARWGAGGLVNALDETAKRSGDATPAAVLDACVALLRLLTVLGLADGRAPLAGEAWRCEP